MIANIIGASGSGKTSLVAYLISNYPNFYQKVISYTNRPKRKNEIHGIDYYFVETIFFSTNNDLCFKRDRKDGLYAIKKSDLLDCDNKVILTTFPPKGVPLLEDLGFSVQSFYLSVQFEERKKRMLERGDDIASITNRLISDETESTIEVASVILKNRPIFMLDGHKSIHEISSIVHGVLF